MKNINIFKTFNTLLLCGALASCGSNYIEQCQNLESSLKSNKNYSFKTIKENNINYLLLNQEAGLYSFLRNDLDSSLKHFDDALLAYNKIKEDNAVKATKNLTAVATSETLTKYEGSDFEEALVHYYKGLAYLEQNDLNKALIEFKASENILKFAQEVRQKKIISQENNINKNINELLKQSNLTSQELDKVLQRSKEVRANNQSEFLNANITYISGIVKEINKQYNDALVNYKQAYNIQPHNTFLINDLYRLSLQYDLEYAKYLEKTHPALTKIKCNSINYPNKSTLYVIYEQGFIPKKDNSKISLMGLDGLILSINLPVYNTVSNPNSVTVELPEGNNIVTAEETANLFKLSNNQLMENYPRIIATQLAKLAIQIAGQKALQANNKTQKFSSIFGGITLVDSADLRSWYTLPSFVKIAKIDTEKDISNIILNINNVDYNLELSVNKNNIVLLYVFDTGEKLYTKILYQATK